MTIKMIHVGLGERGRHWLGFVGEHDAFETVACVDADEKAIGRARGLEGQGHGRFFSRLEDAAGDVEADAVLITTPSFLHAEHALEALDAGLHVMVEKPLGCSLADAQRIVTRAGEVGRQVMVAENFRFFRAERTLRDMIERGRLGAIRSVVCVDRRDQPSHTQGPWVKGLDHPFFTEIAVHHFDSFRYLFARKPVSITARSYRPPGSDYDGDGAVQALIEMEDGFPIQYGGTFVANRYEYRLWIEGENGDVWTDRKRVWWRPRGRAFYWPAGLVAVPPGDEQRYPKAGTVSLLDQFRGAVAEGREPETSGADNLWTLAMMEAGILSARESRRVTIDEVATAEMRGA